MSNLIIKNKRPLRVAVVFDQQQAAGGGFYQSVNAAKKVCQINKDLIEPIFITTTEDNLNLLLKNGIQAKFLKVKFQINNVQIKNSYRKTLPIFLIAFARKMIEWLETQIFKFENQLENLDVDLVYFLSPSRLATQIKNLNYFLTVWDLCHRDELEFPEVRQFGEIERRERYFIYSLKRAAAIFVDSDLGAQNMAKRYGIDMERIYVSPFDPAFFAHKRKYENQFNKEAVLEKYNIKTPYIFYPAQFWAHKNHIYVLEGLKILEQEYGISMGAVFCGVDYGNKKYVQELAQNLELLDRVYFVGYVSDDEMLTLYANSFALVMPTYFGPTNLPPLEAFILGIPVLYSDLPGMREQVKGAALLLDLLYPETMAIHLKNLSHDSALREKLTASGKRQMQDLAHRNNSQKALEKAFEKFFHKRKTWS